MTKESEAMQNKMVKMVQPGNFSYLNNLLDLSRVFVFSSVKWVD